MNQRSETMDTNISASKWLAANGYPGYGESFARMVRARVFETGEGIAQAISYVLWVVGRDNA